MVDDNSTAMYTHCTPLQDLALSNNALVHMLLA